MESNSVFSRILRNNVITMIILLLIISVIACVSICINYNRNFSAEEHLILQEYVKQILSTRENAVQQTNTILQYNYMVDNISTPKINMQEKYSFSFNINSYLDAVSKENNGITIYTSNGDVYENKYINKIEKLADYEKIESELTDDGIVWDNQMKPTGEDECYFKFYRRIGYKPGNILECRVIIPKPQNDMLGIAAAGNIPHGYIAENIDDTYAVVLKVDMQKRLGMYIQVIICTLIITMLVIALMMLFLYRQNSVITSQIKSFIEHIGNADIDKIDENMDSNLAVSSADDKELKVIKRIIYELVLKIRDLSQMKYNIEVEKKNLEFYLLQSQIDPHTLYNSLSAIKYNAFIKDDNDTINLVDNMVSYYRAALNRGESECTIADELEMIRLYIRINELSNDMQYNLEIEAEEGVGNIKIAHLFLQPFIENAVIHGLNGQCKKCRLKVKCKKNGEFINFTISDNGYGIEPEKLESLNNISKYSESYGIKNAYRRMRLLYGQDSTISFSSKQNEGTVVEICLHIKQNGNFET